MAKIRVSTGKLVDPFNLQPEDLDPAVMIHSICLLNRYHGHTKHPYSVGQHSCNLYWLVPEHLKSAAIVHDMSEAFFNDVAAPVKYSCPDYVSAEHAAEQVVMEYFGMTPEIIAELKRYDKDIYINERDYLFPEDMEQHDMGDHRQGLDLKGNPPEVLFGEYPWQVIEMELRGFFSNRFPEFPLGETYAQSYHTSRKGL